jgi:hypothetical protein
VIALFKKFFRPRRPITRIVLRTPLRDDELLVSLNISPDHPVWKAINEIIHREISAGLSKLTSPELASKPGELAHASGGVEALSQVVIELNLWRERALKES